MPPDILDLDPERLRALGYWVVDRTIEHLRTLADRPAISSMDAAQLRAVLGGPVPLEAGSIERDLALLADVALENQQHGDHPRYFARVPGPSSHTAILGEWLATGMQSIASSWGGGSGPSAVELIVLDWLRDALGLAPASEGILLSGGSMANVTALITARSCRGDGVVYLSDQTHSSIRRGLTAMGQPDDRVRVLPSDATFRLDPGLLRADLAADAAAGRRPLCVVATVGSTNVGAVDDLPAIASACREHQAWLHVDGAYGGPAALTEDRAGIRGLELADSFALDPHKWLFQPYDLACLFVAQPGALQRTFAMSPEYLADVTGGAVDLRDRSLELTRRARAIKLWLTIRTYGLRDLSAAVSRGIALAEHGQAAIEADPRLEVVTPAQLGVVTFAGIAGTGPDHARAAARLTADGFAAVTSTVLARRTVLRLCTINPRTTTEDVERTIDLLAGELAGG